MFDTLSERLNGAVQKVTGRGRITEDNVRDTVRQIRMALLEADVALPVVKRIVERVRQRALGAEVARSLNPGQAFVKIVNDELVSILGREQSPVQAKGRPAVLLLVGLQGAGKTTTAGKLTRHLAGNSPGEVLMVSTDVYRPAAREQLETVAGQVGAGYLRPESDDPRSIAVEALAEAKRRGARWIIVDTAGRLHVDEAMMSEVRSIHEAVEPSETLFIVDAMLGQDAVNSAKAFHEALPLTGAILTKADGDARGGAALSVREITGVPIKLVGTGEKLDALEAFVPERFASRILGMGDVVGLVEQVEQRVDRDKAERVAAKVKKGRDLNLEDYRDQLEQLIGMGGLGSVMEKLPGVKPEALSASGFDDGQLRRQIAIINSMTRKERRRPALIDGSRKRRIAAGCGLGLPEVNRLLKQHRQLSKTMKRVSKGGGLEKALGGAMRGRGGPPGRLGR